MKLPPSLAGLAGPVTPDSQRLFLRELKQAFRERVEHRAPPIKTSIDRHLQSIFSSGIKPASHTTIPHKVGVAPTLAAKQCYIDGTLDARTLHEIIGRTTNKNDLEVVKEYATKAGHDLDRYCVSDLSARYAAKLLQLGHVKEVKVMIERNGKQWLATQNAHPVLIQYASRARGILEGQMVFEHLLELDVSNRTTPLVRTLLRESVRHSNVEVAMYCLGLDIQASRGQETGLARWLNLKNEPVMAFEVLQRAEPALAKEAAVGLDIAKVLIAAQEYELATKVVAWVRGRYTLSIQHDLRHVETLLGQHAEKDTHETDRHAFPEVTSMAAIGQLS